MNINTLINEPNVIISVSPADLKEFALELMKEQRNEIERRQEERQAEKNKDADVRYMYTRAEVAEKLGVGYACLWRWAKHKYLCPVKIGQRVYYRREDVRRIIEKG